MTDKSLKTLVENELQWEPSLDDSRIGVAVSRGVVTLSGSVETYAEKLAAEHAAQRVKGVRGVALDLDVRPFGDSGADDDEVAKRALNSLDWNTMVPKGAVKVAVDNGVVTLMGDLDWQYQRDAAERAVQRLYGVRSVINQIHIRPKAAAGDVKSRIVAALHRQARIDADNITVTVDGGKVRLDGKVNAWGDRGVIERAAWAAPGVVAVEDRVTISA